MRIGGAVQLTEIVVRDLTFRCELTWGDQKAISRAQEAAIASGDQEQAMQFVEDAVLRVVRSVEGLEGPNGEPITDLRQEVAVPGSEATLAIDLLPGAVLAEFIAALGSVGAEAPAGPLDSDAASGP